MRVAAAALALSGTGLLVTGVAQAVTTVAPTQIVGGPDNSAVGVSVSVSAGDSSAADPTDGATATTSATGDPDGTATGTAAPTGTATATGGATGSATATAGPTSSTAAGGATAAPSGSATAAAPSSAATTTAPAPASLVASAPRQSLAETGTGDSVPWMLAGGVTMLAGGLVFRFGPRSVPQGAAAAPKARRRR